MLRWRTVVCAVTLVALSSSAMAQVLLDRVLARVNGAAITLSDVRAGLSMGLIVAGGDEIALATEQWIQRQLLLAEVERFPPPEPSSTSVAEEASRIRSRLAVTVRASGVDDRQVRQSARDTLRIRAYLEQRFGLDGQVGDDEVRSFYAANPVAFTRNGVLLPFDQVEPEVRQLAGAARRQATIAQWLADLRQRADVVTSRP